MIGEVLKSAFGAIEQGLMLANTNSSRKYVDKLYKLKKEILEEEGRGYDSDDTRVEFLHKEIKITFEAAENEIKLANSRNKS